jgi:predicted nucleic acid-binding protein
VTDQLVIDSCVCVKWVIHEQDSEKAIDLLGSDIDLIAPDMVLMEAANALWKNVRRGLLTAERAQARLADLPGFFNRLLPSSDFVAEALALGLAMDLPIYDCAYVVASRRSGAKLVTADTKLVAKLANTADGPNVIHLTDWN